MKITFEGENFLAILNQIEGVLAITRASIEKQGYEYSEKVQENTTEPKGKVINSPAVLGAEAQGPSPEGAPAVKPKPSKGPKAAKAPAPAAAPVVHEAPPADNPFDNPLKLDPADLVKIRQATIEELQSAYANGKQQQVFELLKTHGNGAKSFRELTPEAFFPIREAIDKGALA